MKIRRLACYPSQEFADIDVLSKRCGVRAGPRKLSVAESGMQGPVADRVKRDGRAPSPALGNGMMPFHPAPQFTLA
jgi:hypothetical protein